MSKVPVTNRKVPVTHFLQNARDFCNVARDNFGNNGRENLPLARETFRKSAREKSKMPVTNSTK